MLILIFAIVGALAQLIDGTLGMAFGLTSTSLLVALNTTGLTASAAVHFAELGTTFASGAAHWRSRNVDWRIVVRLGLPGALGAAIGASLLSRISITSASTWMSWLLLVLGMVLVIRFGLGIRIVPAIAQQPTSGLLAPLGAIAGFFDASGGGGWGTITTPTLLSVTRLEPKMIIGTVSAAEFMVAFAASGGFVIGSATRAVDWQVIAGLLLGGVLMAPFAALLAGRLPHAPFGTLIGGIVMITNANKIIQIYNGSTSLRSGAVVIIGFATIWLTSIAWRREHRLGIEHSFFEETS